MISCASIYHHEIPDFMKPYLETEAIERLKFVDMNCGMNYTSFRRFVHIEAYSRFHHSLGCALIVWHFTHDQKQSLAALFHDIATPAFSHVIDFVHHDYLKQETTENLTAEFIRRDAGITKLLEKDGILLNEVSDYHIYPIADNDSPRLSADRLEYICGDILDFKLSDEETVKRLYNDLCIMINEEGHEELVFMHDEYASQFAHLALECGRIYSGDENRYAMDFLADLLRDALNEKLLSEDDLYRSEKDVIAIIRNSRFKERLKIFMNLCRTERCDPTDPLSRVIDAKKRYINPLCRNGYRIAAKDENIRQEIREFLDIDYRYPVKGVWNE